MAQNFQLAALTLLLTRLNLDEAEREFLEALKKAAELDVYWQHLSRFHAQLEDVREGLAETVANNIAAKARMAGLVPVLETLKNDLEPRV